MFFDIADLDTYFGPFRLFRYLSFRCVLAMGLSFIVGMMIAPRIIAKLHEIKFGQSFRSANEVGKLAQLHERKKGTPTMGGVIIYISVMVSSLLLTRMNALVFTALFVYTSFTILGFLDDYLKILKKNSKGVPGKIKMAAQAITIIVALAILLFSDYGKQMHSLYIPFLKDPIIAYMPIWFMAIFLFLIIAGSSNAVNLTDGVDGLATGCTISTALAYGVFTYVAGNSITADYLFISYVPACGELSVICCALIGAAMAFLWFNAPPAEVFMGDTGSLAIGGLIGSIAFMVQQPFTLVIVGGIFVMEAMSVMIQVFSFKSTGKKVFLMSPIHHHFEIKGWAETKVVVRFWIVSLIFAMAGLATLKLR